MWFKLCFCVVVCAAFISAQECPVDLFTCRNSSTSLYTPSWCSMKNPFIIPQPPTKLANATATTPANYVPVYSCPSEGADPYSSCHSIDSFLAKEVPAYPNTTMKLIVVAHKMAGEGTNSTSMLSIYDDSFTLMSTPIYNFDGHISSVNQMPNPKTNYQTSLITYSGDAFPVLNGTVCNDCGYVSFIEMNLMQPSLFANKSAVYVPLGDIFCVGGSVSSVQFMTVNVTAPASMKIHERLSQQPSKVRGVNPPGPDQVPLGPTAFAASSAYIVEPDYVGWVIYYSMYFPADNAYCVYYANQTDPCFITVLRTEILRNGQPIARSEPVAIRISQFLYGCNIPAGTVPLEFVYSPFYNSSTCEEQILLWISTETTVSVFAFEFGALSIDLLASPMSQVVDVTTLGISGGTISIADFQAFTEVSINEQTVANASVAPVQVAPADVWCAIALTSGSGYVPTLVFRLPQFSDPVQGTFPPQLPPTSGNPAGQPPSAQACGWNLYWDGAACQGLPYHTLQAPSSPSEAVNSIVVQWRSMPLDSIEPLVVSGCLPWNVSCIIAYINSTIHDNGDNDNGNSLLDDVTRHKRAIVRSQLALRVLQGEDPADMAQALVQGYYGNRFAVFAATNDATVLVHELIPIGCANDSVHLIPSFANDLSMMGPVSSIYATDNAQYIFAAVDRPRYFLAGLERLVEVCNALDSDPDDPFLSQYASSCAQRPRYPAISDFLQVGGACLPGMYCPSFSEEVIGSLNPGSYTIFGFDETPCEPGYSCASGTKSQCPTGFVCPEPGMVVPQRCAQDSSLNSTCFSQGLSEPQQCSQGTLCGTPYLPPIPALPGYYQSQDDGVRVLLPCEDGEWCGLGRSDSDGVGALLCPAGTYCSAADVLEPVVCDLGGLCNSTACPEIPYCPSGTTTQMLCPAGSYCPSTTQSFPCSVGTLCPPGSPIWQLCPAGHFCANASSEAQCPVAAYCPVGSSEPIECSKLSHCYCDGGCAEPPFGVTSAALAILAIMVAGIVLLWVFVLRKRWQACMARRREYRLKHKVAPPRSMEMSGMYAPLLDDPTAADSSINAKRLSTIRPGSLRLARKPYTIDVEFEDLGLKLKSGGKVVLEGVTGSLRHNRVTAVMGPSGAGKTTFLTALCGKATYGNLTGTIKINGKRGLLTDRAYRHLVGFVPQEDVMMRDMTVEENIAFAALTRLPSSWSREAKLSFADSVIELLGLHDIRDSIIGDENVRGISGGQRKRVNIGLELAADPTILFLDEPTSGLDATSSMEVCNALRRIADLGLTVALVLHQPRYEIFTQFDDLLLLGKGGRTVYIGPVSQSSEYFQRTLQIECPPRVNPADFLLDVVGGDPPKEWKAAHPEFSPSDLFSLWVERRSECIEDTPGAYTTRNPPRYQPISFVALLWQVLVRSATQQLRHPWVVLIDNLLVFVSAFFLAVVYFGTLSYGAPEPIEVFRGCPAEIATSCQVCLAESQDSILNRAVMTIIAISLTGVATFLRVFGNERIVYWREASALSQPKHTIAYFVGKDLSMLPQMLFGPLVFTMAYEALTTPRADFSSYYVSFLGVYWCASAFGYLTSVLAPASLSQLLGVVTIFGNAMFAGGQPTLVQLREKFIPLCYVPYLSFMRYALEAIYVQEVVHYEEVVALQGLDLASLVNQTFGYDINAASFDLAIVFLIGALVRLLALVAMIVKDGAKKK